MTCAARPRRPVILVEGGYLRLSLSNTLGWLVGIPEVAEGPVGAGQSRKQEVYLWFAGSIGYNTPPKKKGHPCERPEV